MQVVSAIWESISTCFPCVFHEQAAFAAYKHSKCAGGTGIESQTLALNLSHSPLPCDGDKKEGQVGRGSPHPGLEAGVSGHGREWNWILSEVPSNPKRSGILGLRLVT